MDVADQVANSLRVVEDVRSIDRLEPLDTFQSELVAVVRGLLADGLGALDVTRAVARVNDRLTVRLLELAEGTLGRPPVPYAWLALGSQGRGEQVLSSDQDSALAFAVPPPERRQASDDYFRRLADLVVAALARGGMPLCDGGYMATRWHRPVDEFAALMRGWTEQPEPRALLEAEVFLDFRPVRGDLPLVRLDRVLVRAGSRRRFLVQMARAAVTFKTPLGLFGRLPANRATYDVKRAGTAAVVLLARLYALQAGSTARTTTLRLDAAAAGGTLSRSTAKALAEAYRFLTALRLTHQLEQVGRGEAPDNLVRLDALPAADRRRLREVLQVVRDVQEVTALDFATYTVM
jgi:CBS domain-containing protein